MTIRRRARAFHVMTARWRIGGGRMQVEGMESDGEQNDRRCSLEFAAWIALWRQIGWRVGALGDAGFAPSYASRFLLE